jgi:hypothetical protein
MRRDPSQPYDWRTDARDCYDLAIAELRRRGVALGKFEPINDEERAIAPQRGTP